ncbi:hypothetical protein N7527_007278 [Penicillium freii]|nr:hypothetical protein N7527_007278 [Penicillium freii]
MLDIFIQGIYNDHDKVKETYKFAIFCGLYKDDPRAIENPYLFEKDWFWIGLASIMTDTLISFWRGVEKCMMSKLLYDGKAFTVDDRERKRLREQAEKEYKAEREREKEGLEKLCAEEDAIWAEQDR